MRRYLIALSIVGLAACQTSVTAQQSDEFLARVDRVWAALDHAIERVADEPSEAKRVKELKRLTRISNALGRMQLAGYRAYRDGNAEGFKKSEADLRELERMFRLGS